MNSHAAGHLKRRENVSGRTFLVGRLVDVSDGHADYHDPCRSGRRLFPLWPRRLSTAMGPLPFREGDGDTPRYIEEAIRPGGNQKRRI